MPSSLLPLLLLLTTAARAAPDPADPLAEMSRAIREAGRKAGFNNLTVEAFHPVGGADAADGLVLSERLATRLTQDGMNVLERGRLAELRDPRSRPLPGRRDLAGELELFGKLLLHLRDIDLGKAYEPESGIERDELKDALTARIQGLWRENAVLGFEQERNPVGVEAVVAGTFVTLPDGRLEVHARLMLPATATVVGAASARVRKDWGPSPAAPPPFPFGQAAAGLSVALVGLWFAARSALA